MTESSPTGDDQRLSDPEFERASLAALLEINKKIGLMVPTDTLAASIAEEAARLLDVDNAGFRLVEGDSLVLAGLAGAACETMLRPRLKLGESLSGRVVREGRTIVVGLDAAVDLVPEHAEADRRLGYTHILGVPLRIADRTIGALTFRGRRSFTERERELAEAFAGQAAIAIEHARLWREATRQTERMRAVAEIGRLLSGTLDSEVVGKRIVESVCALLDGQSSILYRLDSEAGRLVALASFQTADMTWPKVLEPGMALPGRAVDERRPLASSDVLGDDRFVYPDAVVARLRDAPDRARLAVPLIVKDRLFGSLAIGARTGRVFEDEEVRLAQAFADQAALALENARLFSLESARRAQIETLAAIEKELAAELNTDRLLELIVERASRLFGAEGIIYLIGPGGALLPKTRTQPGSVLQTVVPAGQGVVGRCAQARCGLLVNDYPASPYAIPLFIDAGIRRIIAQPLIIRERLLGLISMSRNGDDAPRFREDDLDALGQFATQAAIALENARLYEESARGRREAELVAELARTINASRDLGTILRRVVSGAREVCGSDIALIALCDPDSDVAVFRHWVGATADYSNVTIEPGRGVGGQVLITGRSFRTACYRDDPGASKDYEDLADAEGMVAQMVVPIAGDDRVVGLLYVQQRSRRDFTDRDELTLARLADHAAIAIRNVQLYDSLEVRARRLRTLAAVSRVVSSSLDTGEVLRGIVRAAAELMNAAFVSFWDVDERAGTLTVRAVSDDAIGAELPVPTRWVGEDTIGWVAEHREILDIPDVFADHRSLQLDWWERHGMKSFFALPVVADGALVAVLAFCGFEPFRFGAEDRELVESFIAEALTALQNSRLYDESQERLRETTLLLTIGQILSKPELPEELMRKVARETARAFGADTAIAYTVIAGTRDITPIAGYRVPKEVLRFSAAHTLRADAYAALADLVREGRAITSPDATRDPRFNATDFHGLPPHSLLFTPTLARGEVIGGLALTWWTPGRSFTPAEVRLIEGVGAQVGLALENADLSRKTQMKLKETETLLSVSRAISSTLDLRGLWQHLLRCVADATGADTVGLWMLAGDGEWMEPVGGYRVPPDRLEALRQLRFSTVGHPFYAEATRTKRPVYAVDAAADARIPNELLVTAPHASSMFVPIVANERVIGGFAAVWWHRARSFSDGELALMEAIASQAGVAIDNARLFEENRRQVEELSVLHELSRALTGQLDQAAVLSVVRTQVPRVFAVRNMAVMLRQVDGDGIDVVLRLRDGAEAANMPERHSRDTLALAPIVLDTGRPLRADDYAAECARQGVEPAAIVAPFRYFLATPMRTGDAVLGVITLNGSERPFTDGDERLLTNIADLTALALSSARLFEDRTRAYAELAAAQDQLVRTEKLRALGEMASGVAHDFNNLLAAILGRAQLLLKEIRDPRYRQWLEVIEQSALDGAQTVRRLQEFTRIRRDHAFVTVDLNQVIRDALEITRSRWEDEARRRDISLDVHTALGPAAEIAGDPAELREVMTNLILNAIDAMPIGGTLSLTTSLVEDEVQVAVADTGLGIPESVRAKIFDPFFTTKGPRGTGLGLSLTYGIVSRHGGRIQVESQEGRGTTFQLTFPRAEPAETRESVLMAAAAPLPSLRCLVVDDEESVGTLIGDVLDSAGHAATVFTDAAEAIERFRAEPFDIVFTDLAMPGVSGWQVARAVKTAAAGVPVFIVTGFGVELSPEECRAQGIEAVLVKPLAIQQILDAVAHAARARVTA